MKMLEYKEYFTHIDHIAFQKMTKSLEDIQLSRYEIQNVWPSGE